MTQLSHVIVNPNLMLQTPFKSIDQTSTDSNNMRATFLRVFDGVQNVDNFLYPFRFSRLFLNYSSFAILRAHRTCSQES